MKLLAAFAFGSVCAYAVAVWAITDWLEIDWRMGPEPTGREGLRAWGSHTVEEWLREIHE